MKRTSPEVEAQVLSAYVNESAEKVGERFGLSRTTVLKILKRRGVQPRSCRYTKYEVDEDYFAVIDTEAKAYWLGFIAADGCVTGGAFKLRLAEKDVAHVEALRASIGYTGPLHYGSNPGGPGRREKRHPRVDLYCGAPTLCVSPHETWCL